MKIRILSIVDESLHGLEPPAPIWGLDLIKKRKRKRVQASKPDSSAWSRGV